MRKRARDPGALGTAQAAYLEAVAPEAVEIGEDRLRFPRAVLLPLAVRAQSLPGMPQRPWGQAASADFLPDAPALYSLALRREAPDALRSSLRMRRTLFEGVLSALAEKTGRRPSRAEQAADLALDEAESRLALGDPAFRAALLTGIVAARERESEADAARRRLEGRLRARGFLTQRLAFIPERALLHFQPGGILFPGINEPVLMLEEASRLLPLPSRQVLPPDDAVWLGASLRDGRDVYFSPRRGLDPSAPPPAHATTLLLGEMGSGKTSLMRSILLQRLLQGRSVVSLDPEGENNRLCQAAGGRVIPAGQPLEADACLLHPLVAETPGELLFAARFLAATLRGGANLTPGEQGAMHDAVREHWEQQPGRPLSLAALEQRLEQPNRAAGELPALLRPFAAGGLWDGFFDRPRALLDRSLFDAAPGDSAAWWNFDLSGLREENRAIVHALLAWFMLQIVSVSQAPLDVFLDEGWRLLRSPVFVGMLDELGRRARKRGIGVMLATHLPEDLATHPTSLSLAATAFLGRLSPQQAHGFLTGMGVPAQEADEHAAQIARLPPHVFYAVPGGGRGSLVPVRVRIPPAWLQDWAALGAAR